MSMKMQADIDRLTARVEAVEMDNKRLRAEVRQALEPLDKQIVATLERDFTKALTRSLKELFSRG